MHGSYDLGLVAVSVVIAILASSAALDLVYHAVELILDVGPYYCHTDNRRKQSVGLDHSDPAQDNSAFSRFFDPIATVESLQVSLQHPHVDRTGRPGRRTHRWIGNMKNRNLASPACSTIASLPRHSTIRLACMPGMNSANFP